MIPFPLVTVERKYKFIAKHQLPAAKNPEAKILHEHIYSLIIILAHEFNPTQSGWTFDFDEIDRRVKPLLNILEGANLNELLPFEPTSEVLACWCVANTEPFVTGVRIEENNRSSTTALRKNIKPEWLAKFTRGWSACGGET